MSYESHAAFQLGNATAAEIIQVYLRHRKAILGRGRRSMLGTAVGATLASMPAGFGFSYGSTWGNTLGATHAQRYVRKRATRPAGPGRRARRGADRW